MNEFTFETKDGIKKNIECEIKSVCSIDSKNNEKYFVLYKMPDGQYYKENSPELWQYVRDY